MNWEIVVLVLGIVWAFVMFGYFAMLNTRTKQNTEMFLAELAKRDAK